MMKSFLAASLCLAAVLFLASPCNAQTPKGVCPVQLIAKICEEGTACTGGDCVLAAFILKDCDSTPPTEFQTELACDTAIIQCGNGVCLDASRLEAVTIGIGVRGLDPLPFVDAGEDSSAANSRQGLARNGIAVKARVKLDESPFVTSVEKLKAQIMLPAGNAGEPLATVNAVLYRLVYEYTSANGNAKTIGKIGIAVEVDAQLADLPGTEAALRTIRRVPIKVNVTDVPSFAFDIVDTNKWSYRLYTRKRP